MEVAFYIDVQSSKILSVASYLAGEIPAGTWHPLVLKSQADKALAAKDDEIVYLNELLDTTLGPWAIDGCL